MPRLLEQVRKWDEQERCEGPPAFLHPGNVGGAYRVLIGTLATYVCIVIGVQPAPAEPKTNALATLLQTRATPGSRLQRLNAAIRVLDPLVSPFQGWADSHPRPEWWQW